jgi:RHS repeat-associated protein
MKKQVLDHAAPADVTRSFTRQFVYDGTQILLEFDESANLLARYTHSGLRTDDVLAVNVSSEGVAKKLAPSAGTFTYLKDSVGTIQAITNSNGDLVQRHSYSAYGILLAIRDANGADLPVGSRLNTSYAFTGRELDSESGLYYYRARYYDPTTGRFLQKDPHPGSVGLPTTILNPYTYANNNPSNLVDPNGNLAFLAALAIGALIAGITSAVYDGILNGKWSVERFGAKFAEGFLITAAVGLAGYGAGYLAGLLGASEAGALLYGSLAGAIVGGYFGASHAPRGHEFEGALLGALGGAIGGGFAGLSGFNAQFFNELGTNFGQSLLTTAPEIAPEAPIVAPGNYPSPPDGPVDQIRLP